MVENSKIEFGKNSLVGTLEGADCVSEALRVKASD